MGIITSSIENIFSLKLSVAVEVNTKKKFTKCKKCGYEKLSSLPKETECKYCGGLMEIVASETKELDENFDQGGLRERQKKDKERGEWLRK